MHISLLRIVRICECVLRFISSLIPFQTLEAKVTVHTIAISDAADSNLEVLAQATGGLSFFVVDSDQSDSISEAMATILDNAYGALCFFIFHQNPSPRK